MAGRHGPGYTVGVTLKIYEYPACNTCRQALKWLDQHGIAYERVHIVKQPPTRAELTRMLDQAALPLRALFNTSGRSYREGNYKERLPKLTRDEAIDALARDGKLIKRPFVLGDEVALVGFEEAAWTQSLRA